MISPSKDNIVGNRRIPANARLGETEMIPESPGEVGQVQTIPEKGSKPE
jgi:hypothetical protein